MDLILKLVRMELHYLGTKTVYSFSKGYNKKKANTYIG